MHHLDREAVRICQPRNESPARKPRVADGGVVDGSNPLEILLALRLETEAQERWIAFFSDVDVTVGVRAAGKQQAIRLFDDKPEIGEEVPLFGQIRDAKSYV